MLKKAGGVVVGVFTSLVLFYLVLIASNYFLDFVSHFELFASDESTRSPQTDWKAAIEPTSPIAPGTPEPIVPVADPHGLLWRYLSASQQGCYDMALSVIRDRTSAYLDDLGDFSNAFYAVVADHPEYWWVDGEENDPEGSGEYRYKISVYTECEAETVAALDKELRDVSNAFISTLSPETTAYERAKAAYEWLALHCYHMERGGPYIRDTVSPLIDGYGSSGGYAKAYAYLCQAAGVPCTVVGGALFGHRLWDSADYDQAWRSGWDERCIWNLVELDGSLTFVDAWMGDTDDLGTGIDYDYFCLTSKELLRSRYLTDPYSIPDFENRSYDFHALKGTLYDGYSVEELRKCVRQANDVGKRHASVKFTSGHAFWQAFASLGLDEPSLSSLIGTDVSYTWNDELLTIHFSW